MTDEPTGEQIVESDARTHLSDLWKQEDWWAIWIAFILIVISMALVFPHVPDDPSQKMSIPAAKWITKPRDWSGNPIHAFAKTQAEIDAVAKQAESPGTPPSTSQKPYNVIPGLLFVWIFLSMLMSIAGFAIGENLPKFLVAFPVIFLMAVGGYWIAGQETIGSYGLEYVIWALLVGLIISNTVLTPNWMRPAVKTELYIKTGLVLLGAEILFGKILLLGPPGLVVAWVVTPIVIIFMFLLGTKYLRLNPRLSIVISSATSVCGVSAAIATAGACRAKKEELTLAIGMSLVFTVLMMVFMPLFISWVGMNLMVGAAWMGGTIDSTGAVVAAGAVLGPDAEKVAAVVKMIQNVLIGLVAFCVAVYWVTKVDRQPGGPKPSAMEIWYRFPKFILGFVAASIVFSILDQSMSADTAKLAIDEGVLKLTKTFRGWFFCLAFVSIGLESNFKELWAQMAGGKAMVLYVVGQSFNLILTLFVAWLMFRHFAF
ncbi:MAG TPA: putative sulfate exporter family transporter [bacterium]|nr:putative sulfate exporter family transporter [bacterium]